MLLTTPSWGNIPTPATLSADQRSSSSGSLERRLSNQSSVGNRSSTSGGRERSSSTQRSSIFALRSMGKTTASSSNPSQCRASSMSGKERNPRRPSEGYVADNEAASTASNKSKSRPLFGRGKSSSRQSSMLNLRQAFDLSLDRVQTATSSTAVAEIFEQPRGARKSASREKRKISAPFDFQHLTHTQRMQLPALDKPSVTELAAEFQAVQESQTPRNELDGIKVTELHFANFSSEALVQSSSEDAKSRFTLILSPPASPMEPINHNNRTSSSCIHRPRHTRSIDSLASSERKRSTSGSSVSPATPPSRSISQAVLTRLSDLSVYHAPSSVSSSRCSSRRGSWWSHAGSSVTPETVYSTTSDPFATPHATSTISGLVSRAMSPFPVNGSLEDVPEEPESQQSQHPGARVVASGSPLRQTRSFPILALASNDMSFPAPPARHTHMTVRPKTQTSDILGSPLKLPTRPSSPRRISRAFQLPDSSWEDDVDYCYDIAAEADCDFDWDNTEGGESDRGVPSTTQEHGFAEPPSPSNSSISQAYRRKDTAHGDQSPLSRLHRTQTSPTELVPSGDAVPELDHQSASPVSINVFTPDVLSPAAAPPVGSEVFMVRALPAVPHPANKQAGRVKSCNNLLDNFARPPQHHRALEARPSTAASVRPPLNKANSYDSRLGTRSSPSLKGPQRSVSATGNSDGQMQKRRNPPALDLRVIGVSDEAPSPVSSHRSQGSSIDEAPLWARRTLEAMPHWATETPSPTLPTIITSSSTASSSCEDTSISLEQQKKAALKARLSKPLPPTPPQSPTSERSTSPFKEARPKRARQHTLSLFPAPLRIRRS